MIWRDTYRLGVEPIDKQHFLLFQMVEKLLHSFRLKHTLKQKNEHIASFKFMKNYIDKHFSAEEAYMESIQYNDLGNHRAEHQNFCRMIAYYEELFQQTDYSIKSVKEFAGLLVSWLTYHVAFVDMKIKENTGKEDLQAIKENEVEETPPPVQQESKDSSLEIEDPSFHIDCFQKGITSILEKMFGITSLNIRELTPMPEVDENYIYTKISFIYEFEADIIYSFPKEISLQLFKIMTSFEVNEVDEVVYSAMAEISNIISGNVSIELADKECKTDIKPPVVNIGSYEVQESFKNCRCLFVDSSLGAFHVFIYK